MSYTKKLWNLAVVTPPKLTEHFSEQLSHAGSLAISVFSPPRKPPARIEAIFESRPDIAHITATLSVIAALHSTKAPDITVTEIPKIDWLAKVADDFPPFTVARWTIHDAQHRSHILRPNRALQIEATSAFGTGEHPTTQGCLILLDQWLKSRCQQQRSSPLAGEVRWGGGQAFTTVTERALDLGCGSGILAMAYAQATRNKTIAIDFDPTSVAVTKTNLIKNGLQPYVIPVLGNGYNSHIVRRFAPYDLIMANIFAGPLCQLAHKTKHHLRPGGTAILSGILTHQANSVIAAHRLQNMHLIKRIDIGEWSVLALRRNKRAKWTG